MVGRDPDRSLCSNEAPWTPRTHLPYRVLPGKRGWGQLPNRVWVTSAKTRLCAPGLTESGGQRYHSNWPAGPSWSIKKTRPPGALGKRRVGTGVARPSEKLRDLADTGQARRIFFVRVFGVQA